MQLGMQLDTGTISQNRRIPLRAEDKFGKCLFRRAMSPHQGVEKRDRGRLVALSFGVRQAALDVCTDLLAFQFGVDLNGLLNFLLHMAGGRLVIDPSDQHQRGDGKGQDAEQQPSSHAPPEDQVKVEGNRSFRRGCLHGFGLLLFSNQC
jgi:hypothetical protein